MADLDKWIEIVKECKYLPENDLKKLCDLVCEILLEESNIQPVSTPVTVCGDIHGQVGFTIQQTYRGGVFMFFPFIIYSFMIWKNYFVLVDLYQIQIIYLWVIL